MFPKTTATQHMDSITLMPPILVTQFSNHEFTIMHHTSLAEEDSLAPMPAESSILLWIRAGQGQFITIRISIYNLDISISIDIPAIYLQWSFPVFPLRYSSPAYKCWHSLELNAPSIHCNTITRRGCCSGTAIAIDPTFHYILCLSHILQVRVSKSMSELLQLS